MTTNWFKVTSLILLGVIIGYSISTFLLNPTQTPTNLEPICMEWLKSLVDGGYVKIIQP